MDIIDLTKAIVSSFWTRAKHSNRCVHRFKPLAPYLLLLVSIIGWKKYRDRMRKANLNSRMMDLPDDVIESILLRLPAKSICCMQCASKAFSNIIDNSLFASLHISTVLNNGMNSATEVPQFMLFDRSRPITDVYHIQLHPLKYIGKSNFKKLNYGFLVSKILSINLYDVEFVFRNLLFFKSESIFGGPSYLLNPFKGEVLMIPNTETNSEYYTHLSDWYGMGFDSTTNTYKIVHAYKDSKNHQPVLAAEVYVLRPRSSCLWRVIQSVPSCDLSRKCVCAYGDMHWLVEKGSHRDIGGGRSHIISFDFKKEEFCWTPHPTLPEMCYNKLSVSDYYFLNMKGSLTIVDVSSGKFIEIWVMKDYDMHASMREVKNYPVTKNFTFCSWAEVK
ncbi:F-box protein At3g07870-like [Argentina anserina]|uniref:F-box protein At3g07870-like n=1 Tax=Argentina anserina TaxID=57926 RepID=UPI002176353D|nr:F-box protein At3g07870-like [Potentilla anserina]